MELILLLDEQLRRLTFSWLLLLPTIAAILIFQGTWLNNGKSARGRSNSYQRRLKAKVLIHRSLIVNLLLAAFIVSRSSLTVLPGIVQGLLVTVILMLPVLVYLFTVVLKVKVKTTPPAIETLEQKNRASEQPEMASNSVEVSESVFDHTQSVEEQMHNIDRSVDHVDIGAEELADNSDDRALQSKLQAPESEQNELAVIRKMSISNHAPLGADQETMPAISHGELTEMVAGLQKDKIKLQKLVIAQKAVIETEKQLRQNANVMTHDAMTVLRRTRDGARVAIRVARQERRERLRFEADNAKVRRQLENAMSAIRNKESVNVRP